jgi:hypothetical protein
LRHGLANLLRAVIDLLPQLLLFLSSATNFPGPALDMEAAEMLQLMDCVVNRTLIRKNLNVTIGKRPPQSFLADLKELNPNLAASLHDYLVPAELTQIRPGT